MQLRNRYFTVLCAGVLAAAISVPAFAQTTRRARERRERPTTQVNETAKEAMQSPGKISWKANKTDGSDNHAGSFEKWHFTKVSMPGGDITKGEVALEIDLTSMTSDNERLTGHLLSNDFFKAEQFPKAKFEIKHPSPVEGEENKYTAEGHLTFAGLTKKVPVEFEVMHEDHMKVKGTATVNRADFNVGDGKYAMETSTIINEIPVSFETPVDPSLVMVAEVEEAAEEATTRLGPRERPERPTTRRY